MVSVLDAPSTRLPLDDRREQLSEATDLFLAGEISPEEFRARQARFQPDYAALAARIVEIEAKRRELRAQTVGPHLSTKEWIPPKREVKSFWHHLLLLIRKSLV